MYKKILTFVLLLTISIIITGCGNKEKLSASSINNEMKKSGYVVEEGSNELLKINKAKNVYIFIDKKFTYQIEFYEFNDVKEAEKKFKIMKELYMTSKTDKSSEDSTSAGNNERYEITTDDKYSVVSRIDNTLICFTAPLKYKSELINTMDKIKY